MTTANKITLARIAMIPFFVVFALMEGFQWQAAALALFCIASATDFLDGYIARKYNQVTDFGKFVDPLADKLLQMSAYICLTLIDFIHLVFPIIMIIKELYMIIGAAILLKIARKKVTIQSNLWGKLGTVFMAMAVCLPLEMLR